MALFQILFKSIDNNKGQIIKIDEYKVLEMPYWWKVTNYNILSSQHLDFHMYVSSHTAL